MSEQLLGFHLRANFSSLPNWDSVRRATHLLDPTIQKPLSVDESIWPRSTDIEEYKKLFEDYYGESSDGVATNGLNLHRLRNNELLRTSRDSSQDVLLAISASDLDANALIERHKIEPLSLSLKDIRDRQCQFLGFDVADDWLTSGLSNCGQGRVISEDDRRPYLGDLNSSGLFQSVDTATTFAVLLNARIPEHSPFRAFGMWMR